MRRELFRQIINSTLDAPWSGNVKQISVIRFDKLPDWIRFCRQEKKISHHEGEALNRDETQAAQHFRYGHGTLMNEVTILSPIKFPTRLCGSIGDVVGKQWNNVAIENESAGPADRPSRIVEDTIRADSVRRKRKKKMNKHKHSKRRKLNRHRK